MTNTLPRPSPAAPPYIGLSFDQLMSAPFPRPIAILPDFLFEGHVGVFGGAFGQGKTYLWLQITIHAAIGRSIFGMNFPRPYKCLFLDTENGGGEMQSRIERYLSELSLSPAERILLNENWTYLDFRNEGPLQFLDLSKASGFLALSDHLARIYPAELVVLDCFGKLFSGKEGDEDAIKSFCARAQALVFDHSCLQRGAMIVLHHCSKPNEFTQSIDLLDNPTEFLAKIRGSGRLMDLVQGRYAMSETRAGDDTYTAVNGIVRSCEMTGMMLQRMPTGFFALHANGSLVEGKLFGKAKRQLELFRAAKSAFGFRLFTFKEAQQLEGNWNDQLITDCLRKAVGGKLVEKHSTGNYQFPQGRVVIVS